MLVLVVVDRIICLGAHIAEYEATDNTHDVRPCRADGKRKQPDQAHEHFCRPEGAGRLRGVGDISPAALQGTEPNHIAVDLQSDGAGNQGGIEEKRVIISGSLNPLGVPCMHSVGLLPNSHVAARHPRQCSAGSSPRCSCVCQFQFQSSPVRCCPTLPSPRHTTMY